VDGSCEQGNEPSGSVILSRVRVIVDGVWFDSRIYWTPK
jgi:hypothetical protein